MILPPLRRTARDAEVFARHVHADQLDKAGRPYVEHLERVAKAAFRSAMMEHGYDFRGREIDELAQIAWLHDVIEDTPYGRNALLDEGFSLPVVEGVLTLTNRGGMAYRSFVISITQADSLSALLVKIADTEDNADPVRLALLDEATRDRLTRKYAASLPLLRAAVESRSAP